MRSSGQEGKEGISHVLSSFRKLSSESPSGDFWRWISIISLYHTSYTTKHSKTPIIRLPDKSDKARRVIR